VAWKATYRAIQAAEHRQIREANRRQREAERQSREQMKLSELERARLEVETYENQLSMLLSVHREPSEVWDWLAISTSLPPPAPKRSAFHELRTKQTALVSTPNQREPLEIAMERSRLEDERAFQEEVQRYSAVKEEWENLTSFARRILARELPAYTEALLRFNPFADISALGSSIQFTVHTEKLIESVVTVNGKHAIPSEVRTLTSTGKLSLKPMAKGRFHELYQDYVCSCVLRVAREVFALLPVDTVLVVASVNSADPLTGKISAAPVLSVALPRGKKTALDFDHLDPSDALETLQHRGDFKASRKTEAFQSIIPFTPADVTQSSIHEMPLEDLIYRTAALRETVKAKIKELGAKRISTAQETSVSL